MSKRQLHEEVQEEVKRTAVIWGLKEYQDDQRRQQQIARRGPPPTKKCRLCLQSHATYECQSVDQRYKMREAVKAGLCLICLTTKNHLAIHCRGVRSGKHLCSLTACNDGYRFHHASICENMRIPSPEPEAMEEIQPEVVLETPTKATDKPKKLK